MYRFTRDHNRVARHELRDNLEALSRQPFGDVLSSLLQARPGQAELCEWAAERPDRWALAVKIFASLAGYTEQVDVHQHVVVEHLGDAEILARLGRLRAAFLEAAEGAVQILNPPGAEPQVEPHQEEGAPEGAPPEGAPSLSFEEPHHDGDGDEDA
jgi:hypothetical protein